MIEELLDSAFGSVASLWWFILPVAAAAIFREWWLVDITPEYISPIQWILLEIKVPRENLKSAKAMEYVFASIYGTHSGGIKRKDRYFKGKVEDWMSFEIVGEASGVHFYVRLPASYRKLFETAFFSQYPEAEIEVVPDYVNKLPQILPNEKYDIFGTDFVLAKEDAYPIKTYPSFEANLEEEMIDPIAAIVESVANLKADEMLLLQLLARPAGDDWVKKGKEEVDKLSGRKKEEKKNRVGSISEFLKNFIAAPVKVPEWGASKEEKTEAPRFTPGQQDALKAVENKLSKLGFEAILRVIYIDNRDAFTSDNVSAAFGAIRQFSTHNLNALKPNFKTMTAATLVGIIFRKERLEKRKRFLYWHYLHRDMPQPVPIRFGLQLKTAVLSVEELATVYHLPTTAVTPARVRALEARKGEAPINLPVIEE